MSAICQTNYASITRKPLPVYTVAHKVQFEILLQMSQTIESVGVNWTSVVWVRYNKLGQ